MGGVPTTNVTASEFIKIAASQIGYREGQDPNGNWNNDNKYGIWYGLNRVAWCGQFVSWVAFMAGCLGTLVPKYQSTFAGLTWFRKTDQSGYWPPKAGDIFMLCTYNPGVWNDTGTGWATIHTGIVEKYLGNGKIQTIEGNTNTGGSAQGNGVYRLTRQDSETSDRIIYCRPNWAPEPVLVPAPPKPGPAIPVPPKPIPGSRYMGSKTIDVEAVRPGKRNTASYRFNGLMWAWLCRNSPDYCRKNASLWLKESSSLYGFQAQRATQEMYRVLDVKYPTKFAPVTLPTWPGRDGVRAIGGTPV